MKKFFFFSLFLFALVFTTIASGHIVTATQTNVTCNDSCNGSAAANVSGGIGPYGYQWNDPMNQITDTAKNLCAGTYTITVTDSSDMSVANTVVTINQPLPITISITAPSHGCSGNNMTLTATASGGTPGASHAYLYSWAFASPPPIEGGGPPDSVLTIIPIPGVESYWLSVTDSNGCIMYGNTTIWTPIPTASGISSTHVSSCGACDGTASVSPIGASPFTYSWSPVSSTISSLTGLCSGIYSVNITDANGCITTDDIKVLDPPLKANFTMVPDSANPLNYWGFNSSMGTGLSYIWDFGDGDSAFIASPTHTYATDGTYTVCLSVSIPGGCIDVQCKSIEVNSTPGSCLALFNIAHDTTSTNPNAYVIYNFSYGSGLNYIWSFGDGEQSFIETPPPHVYSEMLYSYSICLSVYDATSSCSETHCDTITWIDSVSRESIPISLTFIDGPSFPVTTGIDAHELNINSISVFPNPFTDITTFEIPDAKLNATYSFELTDVMGKKVRSLNEITGNRFQVSRSGLNNGIYFYMVYTEKRMIGIGKLVIE